MNFVRGVAGLLRRSSVGQAAENSPRQQRDSSPAAFPWPEIEFSNEGDEKVLCAFWRSFQEAHGKEERTKALELFLSDFLRKFENWVPTDSRKETLSNVPFGEASPFSSVDTMPGDNMGTSCLIGHPTRIIVGLVDEMKGLINIVSELPINADAHEASSPSHAMETSLQLVHALAILMRSSHNRQIFTYFGGFQTLMALMKAGVIQLKAVANFPSKESTPSLVDRISSFVHHILVYTVSIIVNFIHGDMKYARLDHRELAFGSHIGTEGSFLSNEKQGTLRSTLPLLETGGLNWLVELLRILRKMHLDGTLLEPSLENLTLKALKAALMGDFRAQNHFRSVGGIEVIIDGIGSPSTKINLNSQNVNSERLLVSMLREFDLQVLSLDVLSEAVYRNLYSLQLLFEIGGVEKMIQIFFWAVFWLPNFCTESNLYLSLQFLDNGRSFGDCHFGKRELQTDSQFDSTSEHAFIKGMERMSEFESNMSVTLAPELADADIFTSNRENFQEWTAHVYLLCNVVCSFLFPCGNIWSLPTDTHSVYDALGVGASYWDLATQLVVKVILGVFKAENGSITCSKGSQSLRLSSTTMQHFVLRLLKKILAVSRSVLHILRKEGVWDVMFSEHFFYFGMSTQHTSRDVHSNQQTFDSEALRMEVISFIEFAATASEIHDNMPECHAFLEALEQSVHIPGVAVMLVKSLHRVLQLAVEPTVHSFNKLDALILFSRIMDSQSHSITIIVMDEQCKDSGNTFAGKDSDEFISSPCSSAKELWRQSREAVFDLFAEYLLTSEEARIISLHSTKTLEVFFNLIWDPESRHFALRHLLDFMKLPPTSEEDQEAKLELCIKYLEALSQSHGKDCHDIDVVVDLLAGVREVLQVDCTYYQALFREGECFVHIVTLLNENLSEDDGTILSLNVLETLTHLLAGNEASKMAFRSLVGTGYTMLERLLLDSHQGSPTKDLLNAILDMLVDESFDTSSKMVIQNEDVIILFFNILRQCTESLQCSGLDIFYNLVCESTTNKASCVRAGLVSVLLDWLSVESNDDLNTQIGKLIQLIGGHSISGKDMRKVFSLLRSTKEGLRPKYSNLLLKALYGMLGEKGPTAFFELSGKDSGIVVTTPMRWPTNKGFTFSCWMRIECLPAGESSDAHGSLMGLFTFLTEAGHGYTAFIGDDKFVIETVTVTQKRQALSFDIQFQSKRWYFLCIAHSIGRPLSGGGLLKVYSDGVLAAKGRLRYPKLNDPITRCTIGARHFLPGAGEIQKSSFSLPFCGQLGPIYLFDESLSANHVLGLFSVGSGYMYSFLPTEVGCVPEIESTNIIFDPRDGLSTKMVFGFNAQASSGRSLFDVLLHMDHISIKTFHEATVMGGTQLCYRRLVKDIVDCVGGVCVFFPLLTQLDQPSIVASSMAEEDVLERKGVCHLSYDVAAEIIELIALFLDQNFANQQHMYQSKGLTVLGYLLQSVSPKHLTIKVVSALGKLLATVANAFGTLSEDLTKEVLLRIHLDPHIWIFTPYIVQRELYMALINYFEGNASLLKEIFGLPQIVDIIDQFYWNTPKPRKSVGSKPLLHPVSREIIGLRPTEEEVCRLRLLLLSLAEILLRDSISVNDMKAFIAYLEKSEDAVCLEDVLKMIVGLLGHKSFLAAFVENVQELGGCSIFLSLLKRQQESLRLLALRIIGIVLVSIPSEKRGFKLFPIAAGTKIANDHNQFEKSKISSLFSAITDRLLTYQFTESLRDTLFDVLLAGGSSKEKSLGLKQGYSMLEQRTTSVLWILGKMDTLPGPSLQCTVPQVFGIILRLLLPCKESTIRLSVLKDLLGLFEDSSACREGIILEPLWQNWMLALMIDTHKKKIEIKEKECTKALLEEEMLIRNIFTTIHFHCIWNVRAGWRHVERTLNFVYLHPNQEMVSKSLLSCSLLGDLLDTMQQARSYQDSQMNQVFHDNALCFFSMVDELLIKDIPKLLPILSDSFFETSGQQNVSAEGNVYMETGSASGADNVIKPFEAHSEKETRSLSSNLCSELQNEVSHRDTINIENHNWKVYSKVWALLEEMFGKDSRIFSQASGLSLGQRARDLVDSLNIPAAEMAAAVVSGGLGAVVNINPSKFIDRSVKLRGERFPRIAFHLVLLYLYRGDLEAASSCVQKFVALLPHFVMVDNEQSRSRLQFYLWCLLNARAELGSMDNGARFHLISQLVRETVELGKMLLVTSIATKDENCLNESVSVHNLLQQDRVTAIVNEEKDYIRAILIDRQNEMQSLQAEVTETSLSELSQLKLMEDQTQDTVGSICINDLSRKSISQLAYDEDQQIASELWCHMFRELTDERGPWSAAAFPNDSPSWWKLDKTEDPSRRRFRLKRNYHFNKLLLYPQRAATSSLETNKNVSLSLDKDEMFPNTMLNEVKSYLFKGLRGISEEEIPETFEDAESTLNIGLQVNAGSKDPMEDKEIKAEERISGILQEQVAAQSSASEVLMAIPCVLITPKKKLAGRLEIMHESLHFYGSFIFTGTVSSTVFNSAGDLNYDYVQSNASDRGISGTQDSVDALSSDFDKGNKSERIDGVQENSEQEWMHRDMRRHRRWELLKVKSVHGTRYLLQYSALEIFFTSSLPPAFLFFSSPSLAKEVGLKIVTYRNKLMASKTILRNKDGLLYFVDRRMATELAERARDQWRRREINNFEYLMSLNTLSGRSYNDLTQYPVLPWVLSDYSSAQLDLSSAASFRDLSKPVGALDLKRFQVFEDRFQNFNDPDIPSFFYGSHYSSMGIVLFYLLRLEPFTSLHCQLQGGKFDHADRLFHSIEGTYKNCLTNTSDVKELIPEFFYLSEFLSNTNKYYLGTKQDGEQIGDVVLPPWAKGSQEEFVSKNREALESEHVSQNLHLWIDLIFGYKQRGRPAVEAANVFYHLTYEGAVDVESMKDELQRAAIEDQIANFGQTPIQLFRKKHPRRGPPIPISRPLYYAPASIILTSSIPASTLSQEWLLSGKHPLPLIFIGVADGKVILINSRLFVLTKAWLTPFQAGGNFTFSSSQDPFFGIGADTASTYRIGVPLAESTVLSSQCFSLLQYHSSSFLLSCGHWDYSFRVISLNDGNLLQTNRQHKDVVSCLSVSADGSVVVTGSHDTTVIVWDVNPLYANKKLGQRDAQIHMEKSLKGESILFIKPRHVLCGHDDSVTSVAVSVELDLVVSGSKDSTCIFHTLREGRYVRSIQHPSGSCISNLILSKHGIVVFFSNDDLAFYLYSINGKHLATAESNGRINCMAISRCGEFLICGGDQGQVVVRTVYSLDVVKRYDGIGASISSLTVTQEDCILAGTQDGNLFVYSVEIQPQKKANFLASFMGRPFTQP